MLKNLALVLRGGCDSVLRLVMLDSCEFEFCVLGCLLDLAWSISDDRLQQLQVAFIVL